MKPLKLVAIFTLVIMLAVTGFSVAIAAVTAPPDLSGENVMLLPDTGDVSVLTSGSSTWTLVTAPGEVHEGDQVRTGADASASIVFYSQGTVRLDANTTITIDQALWNEDTPDTFQGRVLLQTGRLWARLFNFISPDSSFEASTGSTVASVRGTVFSLWRNAADESGVYVDEHAVAVTVDGQTEGEVSEGERMNIGAHDKKLGRRAIGKARDLDDNWRNWIEKNRGRDRDFDARVRSKLGAILGKDSALRNFAERVRERLTFNPVKRAALVRRFDAHRKLRARLEQFLTDRPLENMEPVTTSVAPAMTMDTTIGEITITTGGVTTTLTPKPTTNTTTTPAAPAPIEPILTPPPTEPIITPPPPPAPTPSYLIVQNPHPSLYVGEKMVLKATVYYSDESKQDVSANATWSVYPDPQTDQEAGNMVINTFYAKYPGVATIEATYYAGDLRISDTISLTILRKDTSLTQPLY